MHYNKYLELISRLPLDDPPALFGFHPNANITKELSETSDLCYDLIKMGEIEGVKQISKHITSVSQSDPLKNPESAYKSISSVTSGSSTKRRVTITKEAEVNRERMQDSKSPEQVMEKICNDILTKLPQQLFDIEAV